MEGGYTVMLSADWLCSTACISSFNISTADDLVFVHDYSHVRLTFNIKDIFVLLWNKLNDIQDLNPILESCAWVLGMKTSRLKAVGSNAVGLEITAHFWF